MTTERMMQSVMKVMRNGSCSGQGRQLRLWGARYVRRQDEIFGLGGGGAIPAEVGDPKRMREYLFLILIVDRVNRRL